MTMIFFLAALVLGVIVSIRIEKVFSLEWPHQREYEQFLLERGKWRNEALLAAP